MNILIVCNHFAVCSGRYAADAFSRLGHNVCHKGQEMGRNIWGMQVPAEYVWNETPESECNFVPDLVIVMDSAAEILDAYAYKLSQFERCPIVVWGVDNHVRDYRRPYFDHYFLAHRSVSVMEWEDEHETEEHDVSWTTREDMTWLPCAYDPVAFQPSPIAWADREYDVCMVGVMYPKRWELVNAMRAAGLKVFAGTGLVYEAYKQAHWNSRVALVSSFNGDLPIRLFEGAGMGCAVVSDVIGDLALLNPTRQVTPIHTYRDADDAVHVAKLVLGSFNDKQAQVTADWATAHTWDARAQVIVSWLEARS